MRDPQGLNPSDPQTKELIDLAIKLRAKWDELKIPHHFRVMGFTLAEDRFAEGVKEGQRRAREAFLKANGLG